MRRCAIATPIVGRLLKEEKAHRRYKESTFGGKAASLILMSVSGTSQTSMRALRMSALG